MDDEQNDATKKNEKHETKVDTSETVAEPGTGSECSLSSVSQVFTPVHAWPPIDTRLDKDEFFHDRVGSNQSKRNVQDFVAMLSALDVYNVFFSYTTVLQRDPRKPCDTSKEHPELNRYADIPCFEETRVKVQHQSGKHDYYHASHVDGYRGAKYILAQAPMLGQTEQWWRLIWEQKAVVIINLVAMDDVECPLYIPVDSGEKCEYGPYTVENTGTRNVRRIYDATSLFVSHGGQMRHLIHIAYYDWSTKNRGRIPSHPTETLNLLNDLNNAYDILIDEAEGTGWLTRLEKSPWVVCCQTGVNRSATFVTLDILCRRLEDTGEETDGPFIDVEHTVLKIRTQRAMAVQRPEQYLFLHLAAYEFIVRKHMLRDDSPVNAVSNFKMTIEEGDTSSEAEQKTQ